MLGTGGSPTSKLDYSTEIPPPPEFWVRCMYTWAHTSTRKRDIKQYSKFPPDIYKSCPLESYSFHIIISSLVESQKVMTSTVPRGSPEQLAYAARAHPKRPALHI